MIYCPLSRALAELCSPFDFNQKERFAVDLLQKQQCAIDETICGCGSPQRCGGSTASAWAVGKLRDTLDNDVTGKGKIVSEPILPERFALLVERAGLKLTPEQFEELRQAYRFVERMVRTVRRPRDRAAEPAHIFVQPRG
jgi:hypothetical protein